MSGTTFSGMRVVAVVNLKGGCGKSTVATHLAAEAARQLPVVMVDLDPQGSSRDWLRLRPHANPILCDASVHQFRNRLYHAAKAGAGLAVIDTPAALADIVTAAIEAADLVLVPVRPTPTDLAALERTITLIREHRRPFRVVLNQAVASAGLTGRMPDELSAGLPMVPVVLHQRTAYAAALGLGLSAGEMDGSSKAAAEVAVLWRDLSARLAEMHENLAIPMPPVVVGEAVSSG